jgi:hypothetical protein
MVQTSPVGLTSTTAPRSLASARVSSTDPKSLRAGGKCRGPRHCGAAEIPESG